MSAAQVALKGPLSTALGQYLFLGFGTFVIFTGDNGVSRAAREIVSLAVKLTTGKDYGALLLGEAALAKGFASNNSNNQAPIIIHSIQPSSDNSNRNLLSREGWTGTIVHLALVSGTCWTAYVVFSQLLPEQIKELLPVTRKYFEAAITSLGQGIILVRDALGEQIKNLGIKTDLLTEKADETHREVLGLKDDIGDVRVNIDDIAMAISRCECSLGDAAGRQTYMSRGVRLLVQCVGDLLRPSNPAVAEELDHFANLSTEMDNDFFDTPLAKENSTRALTYHHPNSPILSEIGSVDDSSIRPISLPRSQRQLSQSYMRNAPASTSKAKTNYVASSPFASPAGPLQMLRTMQSRTMNRQASCPENEVPKTTNKDIELLPGLDEVDKLLKFVRRGEVPAGV